MYNKGKYVVGRIKGDISISSTYGAIVFPETISHNTVASLFDEIRTAGFFSITGNSAEESGVLVEVHGGSPSLGVSFNESDILYVRRALGVAIK